MILNSIYSIHYSPNPIFLIPLYARNRNLMESKSPIPAQVKLVRCDLSDYLWHFCRDDQNPCDALSNILSMQLIRASVDRDTSLNKVSFTEAPLEPIRLQAPALRKERFPRFSLYGIGFSKTAIFRRGEIGRAPV